MCSSLETGGNEGTKVQTVRPTFHVMCLVFVMLVHGCTNSTLEPRSNINKVILVIGDGMDAHQIAIARNYLVGPTGRLALDDLPGRSAIGLVTVKEMTGAYEYVTDSASTASALATGVITSRGRISTLAGTDQDVPTIVELAHRTGIRTGVISTAAVTDATPAAFATHAAGRWCKTGRDMQQNPVCAPDRLEAGGPGPIALQLVESELDVLLGGGRSDFGAGPGSPIEASVQAGFTLLESDADLKAVSKDVRWLGLFTQGNYLARMQGEGGRTADKIGPKGELPKPFACVPNPAAARQPSLPEMTRRAVERLTHDTKRGFFLVVESALIDKSSHVRDPCGSIGGLQQLDETVRYLVEYSGDRDDTLIIVTADHTQAAQLVPESTLFATVTPPVRTPGHLARLRLPDGSLMGVNYATNSYFVEEHTGADVPLYTNMPERFRAFLTQAEIFTIMREFLGL